MNSESMNIQTASIHRSGRAADSRPRLQFCGDWLTEIGFVNGALVQTLPEPNGLALKLCNENILSYSELVRLTREQGGALNKAYIANDRCRRSPTLVTTGKHLLCGGLKVGDSLIAKYEYGLIRVRRLDENVRIISAAKYKDPKTGEYRPRVFIWGDWLNDIGFTPDTLMTVASEPGLITFTAYKDPVIYNEIVRHARANKMQLVQVSYKTGQLTNATIINLQGARIENAGFGIDDIFYLKYEYGVIKLQKLDPGECGF